MALSIGLDCYQLLELVKEWILKQGERFDEELNEAHVNGRLILVTIELERGVTKLS
jgi:hypothetical protein